MGDDKHELNRLNAIFDGDGTELRQQFIYAGLLLTIFERFKRYAVNQIDEFFSTRIEIKEGSLKYARGKKFKELVRERGVGQPGQHANKEFRTALHWFYNVNAIDKDEFDEVERLYILRNEIGHALLQIVAADGKSPITLSDVVFTLGIYVKIVWWWVKEIEATTDPDMNEEKYDSADWDNVESIDTMLLREIVDKTLADNPEWQDLQGMSNEYPNE
jgi:hypothetical protein